MKKAFTLIEVLIAGLLLGIVLTGTSMYIITSSRIITEGINEAKVQTNLRLVLNRIAEDVRSAAELSNPTSKELIITYKDGSYVTYKESGGVLERNDQDVQVIGAESSKLTINFSSYLTGKFYSLDYYAILDLVDNGNTFASINCRNIK